MTEIGLVSKKGKVLTEKQTKPFLEFWEAFNYKNDRANAIDAWLALKVTPALHDKIVAAARRTAQNRPSKAECEKNGTTPIYAQGWLSGRRFEDEGSEEHAPKQTIINDALHKLRKLAQLKKDKPELFISVDQIKELTRGIGG